TNWESNHNFGQNSTKLANLRTSSDTMALIDAAEWNAASPSQFALTEISTLPYRVGLIGGVIKPFGQPAGSPTFHGRHNGKGNILWYDGHVSAKAPYITTLPTNLESSAQNKPLAQQNLGFLVPFGREVPEADFQTYGTS